MQREKLYGAREYVEGWSVLRGGRVSGKGVYGGMECMEGWSVWREEC